ncbi:two component transcriptional regulator, LytTR family [Pseudobutyrivibrio sp. UC1225]|uniref:LytR/AlgR family response regulator transcription factor n=1 Tax=Pseudobutyrivibrio sp. UC1225 TaxID=1798185 RepID=UPI0008ED3CCF|nr:LytTR family DNA-binding domain-containing protein [Pseudobutyrivibrio sp. UC1225]SFO30113.1 two component transcriptional regulator, LytTR family [Pseudobutyrivibrio sp. UC1225]
MHRVAICDDEKKVCAELENIISAFFQNRRERCEIEVWYDAKSLCSQIEAFGPDVLFLDIELPDRTGVSAGRYIRDGLKRDDMNIIFISHNTSYAMELFQIHPYDFLVKPLDSKTITSTLMKLLRLESVQKKSFCFRYNKISYSVPYGDILYFSSNNKTVIVHKINGEHMDYYGKLRDFINDLPIQFACIGKSYIINMNYIRAWKSDRVLLDDGVELLIAQSRRGEFKRNLLDYKKWENGLI